MAGCAGRWQIFPLAAVSVEEQRGRGQPPSLGESSDLQPLAFLQYLPEFGGEGFNRAEHHPTAEVVYAGWSRKGAVLGAEQDGVPNPVAPAITWNIILLHLEPVQDICRCISQYTYFLLPFLRDPFPSSPSTLGRLDLQSVLSHLHCKQELPTHLGTPRA